MSTDSETRAARHATLRCPFCLKLNRVDVTRAADRPRCGSCERPMLLDRPLKIAGDDVDRLISEAEVPVLVDFYADWCGPCKVMAPVLDEVARDRAGEILVAKLDTDAHPAVAQRFGIRGIPTLVSFRDGREANRAVGAIPAQEVAALLD